tara:strand:- start:259 stop:1389 length:1131 start_codon:yes stop_codon:yes gene_type:complete
MPRLDKDGKWIRGNPKGDNTLSSKELFQERSLYRDLYSDHRNTIDFWYENTLYGRIDNSGNAVYPRESFLKQVVGSDCVFALNFVADAYGSFVDEYNFRNQTNPDFLNDEILSPRSISPKRGWQSVSQIHHQYIQSFYETFAALRLQNSTARRNLVVFENFVKAVLDFIDQVGTVSPFTRTGLISGLNSGPLISGLCLDLSLASHASDSEKHLDFYQNPLYYSYRQVAQNNGFLLDRNAPWRLVADLSSPAMKAFMRRYGVRPRNLFEKYYHKSYTYDIASIKVYMENFYKTFIASQTLNAVPSRQRILESDLANDKEDSYWIEVYMRVRQSEVFEKLSRTDFDLTLKEVKNYKIDAAARYINENFLGKIRPNFAK